MDQMAQPSHLPRNFGLSAYKARLYGWIMAVALHLVAAAALFYVGWIIASSPGIPDPEINVALTAVPSLADPGPQIPPQLVQPRTPVALPPELAIAPELAELRSIPLVTAASATRGESQYLLRLWRFVLMNMRFPRNALLAGIRGVVWVHVVIDRDGRARLVEIETSSGSPELDAAALDVIVRSQPLPPLPDDFEEDYFSTVIRLGYGAGLQDAP